MTCVVYIAVHMVVLVMVVRPGACNDQTHNKWVDVSGALPVLVGLLDLQSEEQTVCALQLLADLVDGNSGAAEVVMSSGAKLSVKACCKQLPLDRLLINKVMHPNAFMSNLFTSFQVLQMMHVTDV